MLKGNVRCSGRACWSIRSAEVSCNAQEALYRCKTRESVYIYIYTYIFCIHTYVYMYVNTCLFAHIYAHNYMCISIWCFRLDLRWLGWVEVFNQPQPAPGNSHRAIQSASSLHIPRVPRGSKSLTSDTHVENSVRPKLPT